MNCTSSFGARKSETIGWSSNHSSKFRSHRVYSKPMMVGILHILSMRLYIWIKEYPIILQPVESLMTSTAAHHGIWCMFCPCNSRSCGSAWSSLACWSLMSFIPSSWQFPRSILDRNRPICARNSVEFHVMFGVFDPMAFGRKSSLPRLSKHCGRPMAHRGTMVGLIN